MKAVRRRRAAGSVVIFHLGFDGVFRAYGVAACVLSAEARIATGGR